MDDLIEGKQYVGGMRWRLFTRIDGDLKDKHVLVTMGDRYTMVSAEVFKRLAARIIAQL